MDIYSALKSYLSDGHAIWNEFEFSTKFPTLPQDQQSSDVSLKNLELYFTQHFGLKLSTIKTFVSADDAHKCNGNGLSNGFPLPLEDDFVLPNSNCLKKSKLLNLSSMQIFLSCVFRSDLELIQKCLPILLFCNGFENRENVFMVYLDRHETDSVSYSRKAALDSSFMVSVKTMNCESFLPSRTWRLSNLNKPDDFIVKHYSNLLQPSSPSQSVHETFSSNSLLSVKSFAQFELFNESSSHMQSFDQDMPVAGILVDVSCDKVSRLFSIDSSHISSINVNLTPVPGDFRSPAHCLFKDLDILQGLIEGFGADNQVRWSEYTRDSGKDADNNNIADDLKDVFKYFNTYSVLQDDKSNDSDRSDDEQVLDLIVPRQELDLTEKVWNVLKFVQSFQELVDCLSMIFTEIMQGNSERFWLHEDADTMLSEEIKKSYQGKFTNPKLVGLLPLQILVEIGIDKLRRDYVSLFVSRRYCTASRLQTFTEAGSNLNVADRLLSKFSGLKKLHHVAELAAYCHAYLQLPSANIHKVVRSALDDYSHTDVDFKKTFKFPASYSDVKTHLDGCVPTLWRMDVSASNEIGTYSGVACWSSSFPFSGAYEPVLDSSNNMDDSLSRDEPDEDNALYYLTTMTETFYPVIGN